MKIKKIIQGNSVELEVELIKDYGKYGLYQIYDDKHRPIYKETFTNEQLKKIKTYGIIEEELI